MTIEIKNLKTSKMDKEYDFRIDRESPLGNPFVLDKEENRDKVCEEYKKWFLSNLKQPKIKSYVDKIEQTYLRHGKVRLFCWCSPKRCHGEAIKEYILNNYRLF